MFVPLHSESKMMERSWSIYRIAAHLNPSIVPKCPIMEASHSSNPLLSGPILNPYPYAILTTLY